MADHPLRPATDRRLGGPLPHQLANPTSAAPTARGPCESPAFLLRAYAVLIRLSPSYPPLKDTFRCITHPFAARRQGCPRAAARLACVKHSASVQSEPGSNSSVQSIVCANPQHPRAGCSLKAIHKYKLLTREPLHIPKTSSQNRASQSLLKTSGPGDNPPTPRKRPNTRSTHTHRLFEFLKSRLVAGAGFEPTTFGL